MHDECCNSNETELFSSFFFARAQARTPILFVVCIHGDEGWMFRNELLCRIVGWMLVNLGILDGETFPRICIRSWVDSEFIYISQNITFLQICVFK